MKQIKTTFQIMFTVHPEHFALITNYEEMFHQLLVNNIDCYLNSISQPEILSHFLFIQRGFAMGKQHCIAPLFRPELIKIVEEKVLVERNPESSMGRNLIPKTS